MNIQERQSMVRDFQRKMGEPTGDTPAVPDKVQAELRVKWILEEVMELSEALGFHATATTLDDDQFDIVLQPNGEQVNMVEVVDALRDIEYHIYGIELILGIHGASDDTFREVHRSNMDKEPLGSGEQRKVTKPKNWLPPRIGTILRNLYPRKALLFRR